MIKYYCDLCGKETKREGGFKVRKNIKNKEKGSIVVSILVKFSAYYGTNTICQECGIKKVKEMLGL